MKKKILLIILMFMFMTNVNALSFDVDITNIEDAGNNGTIGSITKIDQEKKEIDAFFQDIGDEVSFTITVTNTGDRAGTLRSIDFGNTNDKIEYTSNLPDGGLAINGNDTNEVTITAKVKQGAVNGKTTSDIKIKYTYDEGSCPDGEILSEDESMCLCPEGMERNEKGICVKPEKEITCEEDEIYNAEKKICEKKVVPTPDKKPINPSNPKTLDNIILITLLFFVSGLGIYAVMFKRLNTNKKKVTAGVITGVITFSISFTVLASVFGLDNLLSAIVNPITKSRELVVKVNEEIELIETWDGECSLDNNNLTPDKIFQGGTGTESDPYQVKTAEQLSCFAKSVNNGETYQGKYIKQTKNIKLNDKVLENIEAGTTNDLNTWTPIGEVTETTPYTVIDSFNGTYDGDNHIISGIYIDNQSMSNLGFFRIVEGATIKNVTLSDNYIRGNKYVAVLVGYSYIPSLIENVKTYGKVFGVDYVAGIAASSGSTSSPEEQSKIIGSENYAEIKSHTFAVGIAYSFFNIIDSKNYGNVTATENAAGIGGYSCYIIDCENHGDITGESYVAGLATAPAYAFNSDNYGNIYGRYVDGTAQSPGGFMGLASVTEIFDCNNYGDIDATLGSYPVGVGYASSSVYKSGNTGTIKLHDTETSNVYMSGIYAAGTREIADADLSSKASVQAYREIMEKDFTAENEYSYNTGDLYVDNVISSSGINIAAIANSGSNPGANAQNTGNIYVSNSTGKGGYITMLVADGAQISNGTSKGNIVIDNCTNTDLEIAGVAISGATATNSSYEGTIEVKNSTLGDSRYPTGTWVSITSGTTAGGYMINTSTKGEIKFHDNDIVGTTLVGALSGSGAGTERSYSEVEVEVYGNTGLELKVAGLATAGGRGITDSYNRGNINVHDNAFTSLIASGGTTGGMSFYGGNYNSGDVYVKDNYATTMVLTGGGNSGPFWNNYYNYGDITLETENNSRLTSLEVAGINTISYSGFANLVNEGNITIPYIPSLTHLYVGGIFTNLSTTPTSVNLYSLGDINIADGYTYGGDILRGNIYAYQGIDYDPTGVTPYAYYVQDGYAMGLSEVNSSYRALEEYYGVKISSDYKPNVLDIINVNDVFEIKEGETLPTLKVFNN